MPTLRAWLYVGKKLVECFCLPFKAVWMLITTIWEALGWFFWGLFYILMAVLGIIGCVIVVAIKLYELVSFVGSWLSAITANFMSWLLNGLVYLIVWLCYIAYHCAWFPFKAAYYITAYILDITGIAALWDPIRPFWYNICYVLFWISSPLLAIIAFGLFVFACRMMFCAAIHTLLSIANRIINLYHRIYDSEALAIANNKYLAYRHALSKLIPPPIVCWTILCVLAIILGRLMQEHPALTPSTAEYLLQRVETEEQAYRRGVWPGTNERIIAIGREPKHRDPGTFTETSTEYVFETETVWAETTTWTATQKVTKTRERTLTQVVRLTETATVTMTAPAVRGPLETVAAGAMGEGWLLAGEDGAVGHGGEKCGQKGPHCGMCEQEHC